MPAQQLARGVLFDVDGTLVDTTYIHALCWGEALTQAGQYRPTALVHRAIGMGSPELLEHLLGADRDRGEDETITAAHLALYQQHWGRLRALPGAADLLAACAGLGLSVVLASSASESELAELRRTLDADDVIKLATSSDDAESGKPHPDILEAALARSEIAVGNAVFVGDSVWDGAAAARCGLRFIGLTCGGTSEAELREAGAVEVWSDPAELCAGLDDSVIAEVAHFR